MDQKEPIKLPSIVMYTCVLFSISLMLFLVYYGKTIILPISFSLLFAILLRPVVGFLNERLRLPHVFAVLLTVVLFTLFVSAIVFFVYWQISIVMDDWEKLKGNFFVHYHHLQDWIKEQFDISHKSQEQYLQQVKQDSLENKTGIIGSTIVSFTAALAGIVLVPIFIFLILLYRNLFIRFIIMLTKHRNDEKLAEIMSNVKLIIRSYIIGLAIEMAIVVTLTTVGLMIVGMQYALLLGMITALLNLIPYIGLLIAGIITVITAVLSSTDASIVIGAFVVHVIVQLLDNNVLIPYIVGTKVRINGFISMTAVIVGGIVAGIPGMFLALPATAILKIVFDHFENFKPWGYLMGDDLPKTYEWRSIKFTSFDAGSTSDTGNLNDKPDITITNEEK